MAGIEKRLNKLERRAKPEYPQIYVCWCCPETGELCDYHKAHPNAPEPDKVVKLGVDLSEL